MYLLTMRGIDLEEHRTMDGELVEKIMKEKEFLSSSPSDEEMEIRQKEYERIVENLVEEAGDLMEQNNLKKATALLSEAQYYDKLASEAHRRLPLK